MAIDMIDYLGNANISFKGVDRRNVTSKTRRSSEYAHQHGSACNSGESTPSHVLAAIRTYTRIYKRST